jgi:hypothetical protein
MFGAGSGVFLLGLLKFKTTYMFSQRRVNIGDLVAERVLSIRSEERQRAFDLAKKLGDYDVISTNSGVSK